MSGPSVNSSPSGFFTLDWGATQVGAGLARHSTAVVLYGLGWGLVNWGFVTFLPTMLRAQLDEYFAGDRRDFTVPLIAPGTQFQEDVWTALRGIPYGTTTSYGRLAKSLGKPDAVRAVAYPVATFARFDVRATAGGFLSVDEFKRFIANAEAGVKEQSWFAEKGWLAILAIVFVGGLALNLTPCVLPLIPINLAIIGAGARGAGGSRGFLLGAAYGGAMAVVYGVLGAVVILTAGYILWAVQRVYLGPEYKGPHGEHLHASDFRENLIGTTLCVFAILFGVFPYQFPGGRPSVLKYMDATIDQQVADLADWTRETEANRPSAVAGSPPHAPREENQLAGPLTP